MSKSIYEMDLHETASIAGQYIFRVPGGWIYSPYNNDSYAVFVPYDNEFLISKPEQQPIIVPNGSIMEGMQIEIDKLLGKLEQSDERIEFLEKALYAKLELTQSPDEFMRQIDDSLDT